VTAAVAAAEWLSLGHQRTPTEADVYQPLV